MHQGEATRRCKGRASRRIVLLRNVWLVQGKRDILLVVAVRRLNQGRFVRRNTLTPEQMAQAADAYQRLGNVRKVAAELGLLLRRHALPATARRRRPRHAELAHGRG